MVTASSTPAAPLSLRRRRPRLGKASRWLVIAVVTLVWLFPIYWVITTSLKTRADTLTRTPKFLFDVTFDNYRALFADRGFAEPLINSAIVAGATTVISMILASMCAYGLVRFELKHREDLALWVLSLRMMPAVAVVIPYYILFLNVGLIDTHLGLTLVYLTFSVSFAVWLLRGFFSDIPRAISEAAELDGCGHWRTLVRVVLPVSRTGLAVTAIFVFIFAWNEFLFAVTLTDRNALTVPVSIAKLATPGEVLWGELTAGSVVAALPLVVVVFVLQRNIVRGLTLGAVK